MIRHVVALELAATDSEVRRRHAEAIKSRLEALADVDQGIIDISVHFDLGLVESHWPLVLVADYVDYDSLESYQAHPRHVEVLAWMNDGVISARAVVDYVID
ncbi:MAG TPA: Dabb family protein [Acidimicrobiales bacterium]|nr:Dabb family protein [Acidimicrobiales bacterium]